MILFYYQFMKQTLEADLGRLQGPEEALHLVAPIKPVMSHV